MPKFLKFHSNNILHALNVDDIVSIGPCINPIPSSSLKSCILIKNGFQYFSDESVETLLNEINNLK